MPSIVPVGESNPVKKYLIARFLLPALLVVPAQAGSALGVVSASGVVWTNDVALPSGSRVWPGDVLRVSTSGLAVVSDPAIGRFEVRAGTEARFSDEAVELLHGVVASQRLEVVLGEHRIAPRDASDAESWFVVSDNNGEPLVAAYGADIVIRSPDAEPLLVPQGQFALAAAAPPAPPDKDDSSNGNDAERDRPPKRSRRRTGAAGAGSKASSGWKLGGLSHAASIAVVTGITAAAVTGVAFGASAGETVSPE